MPDIHIVDKLQHGLINIYNPKNLKGFFYLGLLIKLGLKKLISQKWTNIKHHLEILN